MALEKSAGPAARFSHEGHTVININKEFHIHSNLGQRLADTLTKVVGSWPFIIYQSLIILVWLAANGFLLTRGHDYFQTWDPYPFILLNLILSFPAAYTGPIVMMSQNRQAEKDRLMAEHDYLINRKSEEEIKTIMKHLVYQDELIIEILENIRK
jgi:uncharacterized membrane protein